MTDSSADSQWCVVALFDRLAAGAPFRRSEWPAHVTIASNFTVDAPARAVLDAVLQGVPPRESIVVRLGAPAQFGRNHDIPVLLVHAPELRTLHERVADRVEALPGFAADEPAFWRTGYRPHLTLTPAFTAHEGETRELVSIAVVQLTGEIAEVVDSLDLT